MRQILLSFLLVFMLAVPAMAETATPTYSAHVNRHLTVIKIEDKLHHQVDVDIIAYSGLIRTGVKVVVTDSEGNRIFAKRLRRLQLYVFEGGQLQVGRGNEYSMILIDLITPNNWVGAIRKKGVTRVEAGVDD